MAGRWKITQAVAELRDNVVSITSDISALAKAEIQEQKKKAIMGAVWGGVAALLGVLALILIPIILAYVLVALGLVQWLAFLITFVFLLLLAGIMGLLAKKSFSSIEPPKRTISAVKNSMAAIKGDYPVEEQ